MYESEKAMLGLLSQGTGTRTLLGSSGAVKERVQRARAHATPGASCGGVGGGWGNSPAVFEAADGSCGGSGGGWGNAPQS